MAFLTIPALEDIPDIIAAQNANLIPVYIELPADLLTPVSIYLKLAYQQKNANIESFLFESVAGGERLARYSFIGTHPYKTIIVDEDSQIKGDPLLQIDLELKNVRYAQLPNIPSFTGGAVGYISYDCVQYFEPSVKQPLKNTLKIPDAILSLYQSMVIFDHIHQKIHVVSHIKLTDDALEVEYSRCQSRIRSMCRVILANETPVPDQPAILMHQPTESLIGKQGYIEYVKVLKQHISQGDIIQAVPSYRISKKTTLHPFNAYRQLRGLNPSPYMFYLNCGLFQIVGASPELLCKVEAGKVYVHPIAGTRKRGATETEDILLEQELLSDPKERAEHIMLVDLGRNDVNRICKPGTVKVDSLMHVEKYSHVMHIVSNVSGTLRSDMTGYDAFRSIFPAGTVSGAPKVKALELVYSVEKENRGVYAGAVGYFAYSGSIDTGIAIRTMVFKDNAVYLQAGGGIVFDSDPEAEYEETVNKLKSNIRAIQLAEKYYYDVQKNGLY